MTGWRVKELQSVDMFINAMFVFEGQGLLFGYDKT